jgi:penicillin-binding protein-related factor A (putative recombinase)
MKNKKVSSFTSNKFSLITYTLTIGFLFITLAFNAQSINEKITFQDDEIASHVIKYFKAKKINNKLYFKFLVLENKLQTAYTLESSTNGTDFYNVQKKEGFKSPSGTPLLYCYSIDLTNLSTNKYRIKRTSEDGINYSSIIEMNHPINLDLSLLSD